MKKFFQDLRCFFQDDSGFLSSTRLIGIFSSIIMLLFFTLGMFDFITLTNDKIKMFQGLGVFTIGLFGSKSVEKFAQKNK